eukprot:29665-Pelagococcus_subviridis.AAC.2
MCTTIPPKLQVHVCTPKLPTVTRTRRRRRRRRPRSPPRAPRPSRPPNIDRPPNPPHARRPSPPSPRSRVTPAPVARRADPEGHSIRANVGVEFKGVRSGVERRRGRGLKAGDPGRRDTLGEKVLKERRSPRRRGRMGTSVRDRARGVPTQEDVVGGVVPAQDDVVPGVIFARISIAARARAAASRAVETLRRDDQVLARSRLRLELLERRAAAFDRHAAFRRGVEERFDASAIFAQRVAVEGLRRVRRVRADRDRGERDVRAEAAEEVREVDGPYRRRAAQAAEDAQVRGGRDGVDRGEVIVDIVVVVVCSHGRGRGRALLSHRVERHGDAREAAVPVVRLSRVRDATRGGVPAHLSARARLRRLRRRRDARVLVVVVVVVVARPSRGPRVHLDGRRDARLPGR